MAELSEGAKPRRGWKIALIAILALAVAGGAVAVAVANSWLPGVSIAAGQRPTAIPDSPSATPTPTPTLATIPAALTLRPAVGTTFVNPAKPVVASVKHGKMYHVVLKQTATGEVSDGKFSADRATWTAQEPLRFDTAYTLDVTAVDSVGSQVNEVSTFTTVPASHEADAFVYPGDNATVGVAQPLEYNFSEPVLNKEAVEKAITVTTSTGQPGAFRWYSDTLVRYRPADFWPANSVVTVEMKLFGMDIGNGMIGNFNKSYNINIGNKVVMEADAAAHSVSILVNDQVTRTFPATLGDADFPSASGYMVLTADKQRHATFKASTIGLKPGDPGDYGSVDVEFATRLSKSGIFIHQATPSAMPFLGKDNLSHGCIGLSAEGAGWVFENMLPGDLVHTVGTPNATIAPTDGFGDWNIPFEQYASR